MSLTKLKNQDEIIHLFDLDQPAIDLDISSERWNLRLPQASVLEGIDVVKPGGLRAALPRLPIGVSLPVADQPVTFASESRFSGRVLIRYRRRAICGSTGFSAANNAVTADYTASTRRLVSTGAFGFGFSKEWMVGLFKLSGDSAYRGAYKVKARISNDELELTGDLPTANISSVLATALIAPGYNYGNASVVTNKGDFDPRYNLTKNALLYAQEGPWEEESVGGLITFNEDERADSTFKNETRLVKSRKSVFYENDTIAWDQPLTLSGGDIDNPDKFHLLYTKEYDKRGVWVTNGRKFWLLREGEYQLYLDLGSDAYKGLRWSSSRLSNSTVMFTCPRLAPRIIRMDAPISADGVYADDLSLAGMLPPIQPNNLQALSGTNWDAGVVASSTGGAITTGTGATMKYKVRAVNLDDGGESTFVTSITETATLPTVATEAIGVYTVLGSMVKEFPLHQRWTHIEIWRKPSLAGGDFFRESRIEIAQLDNEKPTQELAVGGTLVAQAIGNVGAYPVRLSDASLTALTPMTTNDLLGGGLPPICQESVSLSGVTICAGRADGNAENPIAYARGLYAHDFTVQNTGSIEKNSQFTSYVYQSGDQFVVLHGGDDGGSLPSTPSGVDVGAYDIASRTSNNAILLDAPISSLTASNVHGYIRRPYAIDYPKIDNDEEIWYSRTDKFAPESFPLRTLRLGYLGHVFRGIRIVGNYAAVVMDNSVYLLYFDGTDLKKDAVSSDGMGTPWPKSIIRLQNQLIWAYPDGPMVMTVSNNADAQGQRGRIQPLDEAGKMRSWFRDAFNNGYEIDAGLDAINSVIRFRRKIDDNTFDVAQFSYKSGRWCMLRDHSGQQYVRSDHVEVAASEDLYLYSITDEGAVFRENYEGTEDPTMGDEVQMVTDDSYTVSHLQVAKMGRFSANMIGQVVRFRSSNPDIDGASRVIRTATADRFTFDSLPGLTIGDEFIVGANRFRVRMAPVVGDVRSTVKTISGIIIRALPGERHSSGQWDTPTEGVMSVRVYADYATEAQAEKDREIPMFLAADDGRVTQERYSGLEGQGSSIEVELECIEAKTDWRIELFEAQIRDDGDLVVDAKE